MKADESLNDADRLEDLARVCVNDGRRDDGGEIVWGHHVFGAMAGNLCEQLDKHLQDAIVELGQTIDQDPDAHHLLDQVDRRV